MPPERTRLRGGKKGAKGAEQRGVRTLPGCDDNYGNSRREVPREKRDD